MSQNEETFTVEEKRELAVKAVNRLIADAEESASFRRYVVPDARLRENKELAEIIVVCIRETALPQLQTLNGYLTSKAWAAVLNVFPWSRIALTSFGNLPLPRTLASRMRVQETFSRVLEPSAESRYDVPTPILISREIFFHPAPGRTSVLTMQLGKRPNWSAIS